MAREGNEGELSKSPALRYEALLHRTANGLVVAGKSTCAHGLMPLTSEVVMNGGRPALSESCTRIAVQGMSSWGSRSKHTDKRLLSEYNLER